MTDTRQKLNEAEFFLGKMEHCQDRGHFVFYLSAFVSAARSVTFFVQKEFAEVAGFKDWYAGEQAGMKTDTTVSTFNELRVLTIHTEPLRPYRHTSADVNERLNLDDHISVRVTRADGTVEVVEGSDLHQPAQEQKGASELQVEWRFSESDFAGEPVLTKCREYLEKVRRVVDECEARFSVSGTGDHN